MTDHTSSGGHLLIDCLVALGARRCFGVPGESYLDVLDALHDRQSEMDFVVCRNEGGAAFMAEAYGKLTRQPGLCFVTRGPGASNASIGVHTAAQNSTPMILFVGQVGTDAVGREAFQEIDYTAFFGSVAKWTTEIQEVARIPEILSRAWSTALSGRPGPVVIALPENVLTAVTPVRRCSPVRIAEAAPSHNDKADMQRILQAAKRPLILVGGGGWQLEGQQALQSFAEQNRIPVAAAFRFQDLIDNHSDCFIGEAGVGMPPSLQRIIREADVLLAIGIRFGEITTAGYTLLQSPDPAVQLIHAHASACELGKIYAPTLPVHAGPNETVMALADTDLKPDWQDWYSAARRAYLDGFDAPAQPGPVDMVAVSAWLREHLPTNTIVTNGAGNFTVWPGRFLMYGPEQRLLAPQSGAMGYGLPAAIAAKLTSPEATVLCFAGDGDFQMNCQEMGTAMQANARPIILIVNNGSYGTIRMHQEKHYPARVSGTDLVNPDFVALAQSYGFHAERVQHTRDFPDAFQRAMASSTGAVIELSVSIEALTPRRTLSQIRDA